MAWKSLENDLNGVVIAFFQFIPKCLADHKNMFCFSMAF